MSSTYTDSNGIEKIGIGEQNDTWGATLDNNFDLIDQALDSIARVPLTANTYNLNISDGQLSNGRCRVIIFTGTPPGSSVAISITPVNIQKSYNIVNQTNKPIILSNGAGVDLTVAANTTAPAFCDGLGGVVGLQAGNNTFSSLTVGGNGSFSGSVTSTGILNNGASFLTGDVEIDGTLRLGSTTITDFVNALIPNISSLPGTLVLSNLNVVGTSGAFWLIATYGTVPGTRVRLAFGWGLNDHGTTISMPGGFSLSNLVIGASPGSSPATGHPIHSFSCSASGGNCVMQFADGSGNSWTGKVNWMAVSWQQSY